MCIGVNLVYLPTALYVIAYSKVDLNYLKPDLNRITAQN